MLDRAEAEIEATHQGTHLVHVLRERGVTRNAMGDREGAEQAFRAAIAAAEENRTRLQGLHASVVFAETLESWGRAGETAGQVDPWLERIQGGRSEPLLERALRLSSGE